MLSIVLKQKKIEHVVFAGKLHGPKKRKALGKFKEDPSCKIMVMSMMAGSKSVFNSFCDSY